MSRAEKVKRLWVNREYFEGWETSYFSSISESTVHIWEGLKQDLSGKLRTIRVGVFKMHAHAHTFYQTYYRLLQIALGVNTLAADANEENCMFDIDL